MQLVTYTAKLGPLGFFKGYIPAFIRLAPQTILTFVFLEQLRKHFGYLSAKWDVVCNKEKDDLPVQRCQRAEGKTYHGLGSSRNLPFSAVIVIESIGVGCLYAEPKF